LSLVKLRLLVSTIRLKLRPQISYPYDSNASLTIIERMTNKRSHRITQQLTSYTNRSGIVVSFCELITGVLGRSLQRGPGAQPMVKKLTGLASPPPPEAEGFLAFVSDETRKLIALLSLPPFCHSTNL